MPERRLRYGVTNECLNVYFIIGNCLGCTFMTFGTTTAGSLTHVVGDRCGPAPAPAPAPALLYHLDLVSSR